MTGDVADEGVVGQHFAGLHVHVNGAYLVQSTLARQVQRHRDAPVKSPSNGRQAGRLRQQDGTYLVHQKDIDFLPGDEGGHIDRSCHVSVDVRT